MTLKKLILLWFIVLCQLTFAQEKPIDLDEVTISDAPLKNYSNSQSVLKLNDSVIRKNESSLTSLLNFNSVIYFKENGLGMVSSPSFRGTTAQQTAVIWNGININSQLNGQTDFNTITTKDFNSVSVRSGGGGVLYGSSAIGGTIHLGTEMSFINEFSNSVQANYGSFNTLGLNYTGKFSTEKFSSQISISRNSSDNDYEYVNSDLKNSNGEFYNTSYNASFGYKINTNNFLKFYSQIFESNRHFSLISPSETKTRYKDFNTRNLLEWSSFFNKFISKTKVGYLTEKYNYFGNIAVADFTYGEVKTVVAKHDLAYDFNEKIRLNSVLDFTQNSGNGSDISFEKRDVSSASLLFRHLVTNKFQYETSVRKEVTANYKSPVLYSAGMNYEVADFYKIKVNFSRNFRIPTFNDLYWQGAGNPDLKPESSYQGEFGNEFVFKDFKLSATIYHTKIRDMIRWLPRNNGFFTPENTNKVAITGAEFLLNYQKKIGKNTFEFNGTYAYTKSENEELKKQLPYVPFHKITGSLGYSYGKISANYQHLFNGKVFTQSDNNPSKTVKMYNLSNISADYDFGKKNVYLIGVKILNLWNENYQSVEGRFMPGRYFNMYLTLNF